MPDKEIDWENLSFLRGVIESYLFYPQDGTKKSDLLLLLKDNGFIFKDGLDDATFDFLLNDIRDTIILYQDDLLKVKDSMDFIDANAQLCEKVFVWVEEEKKIFETILKLENGSPDRQAVYNQLKDREKNISKIVSEKERPEFDLCVKHVKRVLTDIPELINYYTLRKEAKKVKDRILKIEAELKEKDKQ